VAGSCGNDVALARYRPDGHLDPAFGTNGTVVTFIGHDVGWANALALQPNGRIVVAGGLQYLAHGSAAVIRYLRDGSLDRSFGSAGKILSNAASPVCGWEAVAVQPDGTILTSGLHQEFETDGSGFLGVGHYALARHLRDGRLDRSFGNGGKVLTSFGADDIGSDDATGTAAGSVVIQPDGRIIAAGQAPGVALARIIGAGESPSATMRFALARYTADGDLDSSFGDDGKLVTAVSSASSAATDAAIQGDGTIVMVGAGGRRAHRDFVLVRFTSDGSLG
jgi:uncharacterized delta-60 repeat protein